MICRWLMVISVRVFAGCQPEAFVLRGEGIGPPLRGLVDSKSLAARLRLTAKPLSRRQGHEGWTPICHGEADAA
jgi:hypothetical protein